MTLNLPSPNPRKLAFIIVIILSFSFAGIVVARKKAPAKGKSARAQKSKREVARGRRGSSRRVVARNSRSSRRGRVLSAKEVRRQRAAVARDQSASLKALERKLRRPLTKKEKAAELRRVEARHRSSILEARRRAEAARQAAIARQRAIDAAARNEVQTFIAKDDVTGEDPEVRRVAVNALGNHAGTVVVMDPQTGRVYSVVNQEWALRRGFKPCSTIKLVTGVAGLSENAIPQVDTVGDGYRIDLTSALAHSDNPFFQTVGTKIGSEKMVSYARELGLGEKTGINVPFEFAGKLPEIKEGVLERRMFSHADGFEVTPLQLGTLVSAMANGGRLLVPQIARTAKEQAKVTPKVRRKLDITTEVWQRMVPGMVGAVNYGSGRRAYDPTQTVAGKTGTCIGSGGWVGLFTSYAPLANPRLAVVVIAQGTDARHHFPAAVAGEIYRELNHRFGTAINLQVATTADDEEKEVTEDGDAQTADTMEGDNAGATETNTTAVTPTPVQAAPVNAKQAATETIAPRNSGVKRVLLPLENKNATDARKAGASDATLNNKPADPKAGEQRPRRTVPNQQ